MNKSFKWIAYLEGTSFLVLLGIAMPLKYMYGDPTAVRMVGWVHGLFFLLYMGALALIASEQSWPLKKTFLGMLAGVVPFGPFIFESPRFQKTI